LLESDSAGYRFVILPNVPMERKINFFIFSTHQAFRWNAIIFKFFTHQAFPWNAKSRFIFLHARRLYGAQSHILIFYPPGALLWNASVTALAPTAYVPEGRLVGRKNAVLVYVPSEHLVDNR